MPRKVTIVFDEENYKKLEQIHLKQNKNSEKFISFSKITNEVLRKHVKQF